MAVPGNVVCLPASTHWLCGKNCRRALLTRYVRKTKVWLALAAIGEDACALKQGAPVRPLVLLLAWVLMEKHRLGVSTCRYFPARVQRSVTQGLGFFNKKPF